MKLHMSVKIRDQAAAIERYVKQRGYSLDAQLDAAELKVRAERKLGKLLKETVNHNGGGDRKSRSHTATVIGTCPPMSRRRNPPAGKSWSPSPSPNSSE